MTNILSNKKILLFIGLFMLVILIAVAAGARFMPKDQSPPGAIPTPSLAPDAEQVTLLLNPSTQTIPVNTEFTTKVMVESGTIPVTGVDLTFSYDPNTTQFVSFTPDTSLNSPLINKHDSSTNTIRFSAVDTSTQEIKGAIEIGEIKLRSKSSGQGQITLTKSQVIASGRNAAIPVNFTSPTSYTVTSN
jgi:hypothetical protein